MQRAIACLCVTVLSIASATFGVEKKPVTNADVVAMIKAGLPESTIIMAIKQGPAGFDTTAAALIELKNQGATAGMLETMMRPATGATPVKTGTGNALLDAYSEQVSGGGKTGVILTDGTNTIQMKYARMESQGRGSFAPFAPVRVYSKLDGLRSACRISSDKPRFEFSMSRDAQPNTRVALILFAARGRSRIIQSVSASIAGVSSGFPRERVVAMEITEVKSEGDTGASPETRYTAMPTSALAPGEYALVFDKYTAYDFGVDRPRD